VSSVDNAAAPTPPPAARTPLSTGLLVTVVLDILWGLSGLVLGGFVILAALAYLLLADEPLGDGLFTDPNEPQWLLRYYAVAEALLVVLLNACLLWSAWKMVHRRRAGITWVRVWAVGMLLLGLCDLVVIVFLTPMEYGYLAVPFVCCVLVTPLWALFHLVAFARPGFRGQLS